MSRWLLVRDSFSEKTNPYYRALNGVHDNNLYIYLALLDNWIIFHLGTQKGQYMLLTNLVLYHSQSNRQ